MSRPYLVAVDFDGTVVDHQFPDVGQPAPGAFEWMKRWQQAGARLMLWTMRSDGRTGAGRENGPVLTEAVAFCANNGVHFWAVNENTEQQCWTKSPKLYAHCYVDDAAFGCPTLPGPRPDSRPWVDWSAVGPAVLAMIQKHNAAQGAGT
jgi:hypothetical protein